MKTIATLVFALGLSTSFAQSSPTVEIACVNELTNAFTYQAEMTAKLMSFYLNSSKAAVDPIIERLPGGEYVLKADVFFANGWGTAVILLDRDVNMLVINQNSVAHTCMPAEKNPCIYKAEIDELSIGKSVTCRCPDGGKTESTVAPGNLIDLNLGALSIRDLKSNCN